MANTNKIDPRKFPPDPVEYDYSNHFRSDVMTDDQRHLEWSMVFTTIRHGNIAEAEGNADVEFWNDFHGVKLFILAGYSKEEQTPVVVTGWPGIHDPRQAIESGRWTEKQLREIHSFNDGDTLESDFSFP